MERETIYFYDKPSERVKGEHIFLNNFDPSPIIINDLEYPTVEHYYQAQKFTGSQFEAIRQAASPDEAKKLSRIFGYDSVDWGIRKEAVMREALYAKFSQNKELKEKLLLTGNARLIEDSLSDLYWGGVVQGSRNRLGMMLEEIRETLRSSS